MVGSAGGSGRSIALAGEQKSCSQREYRAPFNFESRPSGRLSQFPGARREVRYRSFAQTEQFVPACRTIGMLSLAH